MKIWKAIVLLFALLLLCLLPACNEDGGGDNTGDGDADNQETATDGDAETDPDADDISGDGDLTESAEEVVDGDDSDGDDAESVEENADGDNAESDAADGDSDLCEDDTETPDVACVADVYCENENEYCWIYDEENMQGYCLIYCDIEGVACPDGYSCEERKCAPIEGYCTGDANCETYQYCNKNPDAADGLCKNYCFVAGEICPENTYCVEDSQDENYGMCFYAPVACDDDNDCEAPDWCYFSPGGGQGYCVEGCIDDDDCVGALTCHNGRCVVDGYFNCGPDGCASGYICDPIYNVCVINCPPTCPEGHYCNADSAPDCIEGEECVPPVGNICGYGMATCCPPQTCSVNTWVYGIVGICQ